MTTHEMAQRRRADAVWQWRHERISWRVAALMAALREAMAKGGRS